MEIATSLAINRPLPNRVRSRLFAQLNFAGLVGGSKSNFRVNCVLIVASGGQKTGVFGTNSVSFPGV